MSNASDKLFLINSEPDITFIKKYLPELYGYDSSKVALIEPDSLVSANKIFCNENIIIFDVDDNCLKSSDVDAYLLLRDNLHSSNFTKKLFICISELPDSFKPFWGSSLIHGSFESFSVLFYINDSIDSAPDSQIIECRKTNFFNGINYVTIIVLSVFKAMGCPLNFFPEDFKQKFRMLLGRRGGGITPTQFIWALSSNLFGDYDIEIG